MDAKADQRVEAPSSILVYVEAAGPDLVCGFMDLPITVEMRREPILLSTLHERIHGFAHWFIPRHGAPLDANHLIHSHLICDPNGKMFDPDNDKWIDHVAIGPHGALPDPRGKSDWTEEAWKKRTVLCYAKYHCLVTLAKGEDLQPNEHSHGRFSGAMFYLKYSEIRDKEGFLFYEDVVKAETKEVIENFKAELKEAMDNGHQAVEDHVLAYKKK